MVRSNQFAFFSGGVVDHVMAMNNYSGENGLVVYFIFKTNIHGQLICYFTNVTTPITTTVRESMVKSFF